jgi:hypothetical protein
MDQQQLRARLFTLVANQGVGFAYGFADEIMQRYGELAWAICCGKEMQLHKQLPERAESRVEKVAR